jgi:hypothetical protein
VAAGHLWRHQARAKGSIPPGGFPWTSRARTQALGVRANSPPAIPSRARDAGRRGAVELVAGKEKGMKRIRGKGD